MNQFLKMKNEIQTYAWGSHTAIGELLGQPTPTEQPQAELWMGAHPKAPSQVFWKGGWRPLTEIMHSHAGDIIGEEGAQTYGGRLPYLFKVLAAETPLSIQAHPNKVQAREGFERENRLKIPLEAAHRNYRDDNHKPECLCALTPFWGLCGFRKPTEIFDLMSPLLPPDLNDLLVPLKQASHSSALQHFFEQMITLDDRMKTRLIDHVLIQLQKADQDQAEARWVVTLNQYYPYDIGVLSPLFLNLVKLAPGEAIFLSAGVLHAYLQGTGIELMANSDNVLRGGLTPKHIDVGELVKVLTFESCGIDIQTPVVSAPFTRTFTSPAEEFELATIQLGEDDVYISDTDRGGEIILCTQGQSCLTHIDTGDQMDLNKGESLLIPHALHRYDMRGSGIFYRARGPVLR